MEQEFNDQSQQQHTQQHQLEMTKQSKKCKQSKKNAKAKKESKKKKKEEKAFGFEANLDEEQPDLAPSAVVRNDQDNDMQLGYKKIEQDATEMEKIQRKNKQLLKELGISQKRQNDFLQQTLNEKQSGREQQQQNTFQLQEHNRQGKQGSLIKAQVKQETVKLEIQQVAENYQQQIVDYINTEKEGLTTRQSNQRKLNVEQEQSDQRTEYVLVHNQDSHAEQINFPIESLKQQQKIMDWPQENIDKLEQHTRVEIVRQQQQVEQMSKRLVELLGQELVKELETEQLAKKVVRSMKRSMIEKLEVQKYNQIAHRLVQEIKSNSINNLRIQQYTQHLIDNVLLTTCQSISSVRDQQANEQQEQQQTVKREMAKLYQQEQQKYVQVKQAITKQDPSEDVKQLSVNNINSEIQHNQVCNSQENVFIQVNNSQQLAKDVIPELFQNQQSNQDANNYDNQVKTELNQQTIYQNIQENQTQQIELAQPDKQTNYDSNYQNQNRLQLMQSQIDVQSNYPISLQEKASQQIIDQSQLQKSTENKYYQSQKEHIYCTMQIELQEPLTLIQDQGSQLKKSAFESQKIQQETLEQSKLGKDAKKSKKKMNKKSNKQKKDNTKALTMNIQMDQIQGEQLSYIKQAQEQCQTVTDISKVVELNQSQQNNKAQQQALSRKQQSELVINDHVKQNVQQNQIDVSNSYENENQKQEQRNQSIIGQLVEQLDFAKDIQIKTTQAKKKNSKKTKSSKDKNGKKQQPGKLNFDMEISTKVAQEIQQKHTGQLIQTQQQNQYTNKQQQVDQIQQIQQNNNFNNQVKVDQSQQKPLMLNHQTIQTTIQQKYQSTVIAQLRQIEASQKVIGIQQRVKQIKSEQSQFTVEITPQVTQLKTQFKINKKDISKKAGKGKIDKNKATKKQNISNTMNIVMDFQQEEYQERCQSVHKIQQKQKQGQQKIHQIESQTSYVPSKIQNQSLSQAVPIIDEYIDAPLKGQEAITQQPILVNQRYKNEIQAEIDQFQISQINISNEKLSKPLNKPNNKKNKKNTSKNKQSSSKKDKIQLPQFDVLEVQLQQQEIKLYQNTEFITQQEDIANAEHKLQQIQQEPFKQKQQQRSSSVQVQQANHINDIQEKQKQIAKYSSKQTVQQKQLNYNDFKSDQNGNNTEKVFATQNKHLDSAQIQQQQTVFNLESNKTKKTINKNTISKTGKRQVKKKTDKKLSLNFEAQVQIVCNQIDVITPIQEQKAKLNKQNSAKRGQNEQSTIIRQNQQQKQPQISNNFVANNNSQAQLNKRQLSKIIEQQQHYTGDKQSNVVQNYQERLNQSNCLVKTQNIQNNSQLLKSQQNNDINFKQISIEAPQSFQFSQNIKLKKETIKKVNKKKAGNKKIPNKQQKLQISVNLQNIQQDECIIKQNPHENIQQQLTQRINNCQNYQYSQPQPLSLNQPQISTGGNNKIQQYGQVTKNVVEQQLYKQKRYEQNQNTQKLQKLEQIITQKSNIKFQNNVQIEDNELKQQQHRVVVQDFEIQFPTKIQKALNTKPKSKKTNTLKKTRKDENKDKKHVLNIQMQIDTLQVQQIQQQKQVKDQKLPIQILGNKHQTEQSKQRILDIESQIVEQKNVQQKLSDQMIQKPQYFSSNNCQNNAKVQKLQNNHKFDSSKETQYVAQIKIQEAHVKEDMIYGNQINKNTIIQKNYQDQLTDLNINFVKNPNKQTKAKKQGKKKQSKKPKTNKTQNIGLNFISAQIQSNNASAQNTNQQDLIKNEQNIIQPTIKNQSVLYAKKDNIIDHKVEIPILQKKLNKVDNCSQDSISNSKQAQGINFSIADQKKIQNVKPNALPRIAVKQVSKQSSKLISSLISMVSIQSDRYLDQVRERVQMLEEDVRSRALRKSEKQKNEQRTVTRALKPVDYEQIVEENIKLRQCLQNHKAFQL